jgi:AraC-like DNA-binding protein
MATEKDRRPRPRPAGAAKTTKASIPPAAPSGDPELSRVRFLSVSHLAPNARWGMPPHSHPFHELIVVFGGIMHVRTPAGECEAAAGDVLFYHAGRLHEEWTDPGHPVETCFITFTLSTGLEDAPLSVRDADGRLRQLILWLYEERSHVTGPSVRARAAYVRALLAEWLRVASLHEHEVVRLLRGFVERNVARPITLDELAYGAGMSKYHYLRLYKRLVGCTPMEDVRTTRVRIAQNLILTTTLPFKEISWRCGLGDQYHMSRLFRRLLDVTPGEIRASVRHRERLGAAEPGGADDADR